MRKFYKYLAAVLIAAFLVPASASASPALAQAKSYPVGSGTADKQEVVYANLDAAGNVNEAYVVNIFDVQTAGQITDHGSYSSVRNLTDAQAISQSGDSVAFNAPAGNFYYQGQLEGKDLPWVIGISYTLDGQLVQPGELGGRAGHLQIHLTTAKNPAVNSTFYDNYLLQVSITLDTAKCSNITAEGATLANAGGNKMITFAIMPGSDGDVSASADVTDFSMPGIDISAVPFSMQIDTPDTGELTDDMTLLTDAVNELYEGIGKLKDGALDIKNGANGLKDGSSGFNTGLAQLNAGSPGLVSGSAQILSSLNTIASMLSGSGSFDLSALVQLPAALTQLSSGLDDISDGLGQLKTNFVPAYQALDAAISAIPDASISQSDFATLYANSPGSQTVIDQLAAVYSAAMTVKGTYQSVKPAFAAVGPTIDTVTGSIGTISGTLSTMAGQIQAALQSGGFDTYITQLTAGLTQLASNYQTFHNGLVSYTDGVSGLAAGYDKLNKGISDFAGGLGSFYSGMKDLYSGAGQLNDSVADMPEQVEIQINDWVSSYDKSGYVPVSFVSLNNDNVTAVQFVIKTAKIEKITTETPAAPAEDESESLWERLKNLFD